jgi:tetratricopeptide (TPR) repeat protein
MQIDPNNKVVKLCAEGMMLEGKGKKEEASKLFQLAWNRATDDFERFIAAHYVARHQENVVAKLEWDEIALHLALKINDDSVKGAFPSLYLNVAKCYEDLNDMDNAEKNYQLAASFADTLPDNGYGRMIRGGVLDGIERTRKTKDL